MAAHIRIPQWPRAGEREIELLRNVLESDQWGGFHPYVREFEDSFAGFHQCRTGIALFNGTVSLELALTVLGIGTGDEVIVPAISFISSATAVSRVGAVPVFVDVEPESFNIDPGRVSEAISSNTRAVMAVHFGGTPCNLDELRSVCGQNGLILLEDAAHAHGSEWKGRAVGGLGFAGSFSFQNGKVLTAGEGGILVTNDQDFAEKARSVANCGRVPGRSFYKHQNLGTNFRMTGFQAAVLLAQLERVPEQIEIRAGNVALLKQLLADIAEIKWQTQPDAVTRNSWYLLVARVQNPAGRGRICRALTAAGVPNAFYPHTLYQNPVYAKVPCRVMRCPVAEAMIRDSFWLSHRVLLAEPDAISRIAEVMRTALARSEAGASVT
jgi:dTDP-4-amino-4,6-dideoxygalactose transaminase